MTKTHLHDAAELIDGDRAVQHGDVEALHGMVAALWNAFLREDAMLPARPIKPTDVLLMMALLKIARTQHGTFNPDDYVDCLGYVALAARVAEREKGADGYPRDRIATLHTGSEAEAHADIIKAAPDMLAALKDARDGLRYWEPVTERGHREKARIYGAVDTAISRAQGDLP